MKTPIYMDYHATTPVDPRVVEAMLPCFHDCFGNPASTSHSFGWEAGKCVEKAREQVAGLVSASADEITFTGGATEANNLALKGVWEVFRRRGPVHFITQQTEHKSVLEVCRYLEKQGVRVTYLPVDENGLIDLEELEKSVVDDTVLISIMFANNEVGTIQPVAEIGKIAKEKNVLFHVDGAQAAGRLRVNVQELGIDLLSFTAHKMYGPKGVGALFARKKGPRVRLMPLIHGGEHERGLRSGTLNVPGIVGFGKACEIAMAEMDEEARRVLGLREYLEEYFLGRLADARVNGHPSRRLPGNLNISFAGVEGESLLMGINKDIAVSASSACSSGSTEPSYVLKAMRVPREYVHSAIRFGLGKFTTREEAGWVASRVVETVEKLRAISPIKD